MTLQCKLTFYLKFSLTEREKQNRDYQKKLLTIAKEHDKARELEQVHRYRLPQDMKNGKKISECAIEMEFIPIYS